jgi:hypothetical protein
MRTPAPGSGWGLSAGPAYVVDTGHVAVGGVGKDAHLPATGQALLQVAAGLLSIGALRRLGGS